MADDPISRLSYEEDPRAQIVQGVESFRDEVDAQRNVDVKFPKGRPRISDNAVILHTPASIGSAGGVGITGHEGPPGGECSPGGSCELPEGDCPHALCISFKATRPETLEDDEYWDRGTIAQFGSFSITPYFYYDGEEEPPNPDNWIAGIALGGYLALTIEVPMTPDDFFSTSHHVTLKITKTDDTHYAVELTGLGGSDSGTAVLLGGAYVADSLYVGSYFASNIEPIMLCGIQLRAAPANTNENDFIFPDDSFDTTIGTGQSITDATVTITGDASSSWVGYVKNLHPPYDLGCFDHCTDAFAISATIADVEECSICVDGGDDDGWKLDPSAVNIGTIWRRTLSSEGLDFTQWESDFPMAFVGMLKHYNSVPPEVMGPCQDTHAECTVGEGGCNDVYSACVVGCGVDTGCVDACGIAAASCISVCDDAGNACADCFYYPGGEGYPNCICHDVDTGCVCGGHAVVQCIAPTPSFPTPTSTIAIWVNKTFYCGSPDNVGCKSSCSGDYAACMDGCAHDDLSCLNDCFTAATVCASGCPGTEGCGAGGGSDIDVFAWVGEDDFLFTEAHDNFASGTCGSGRFGQAGTVTLGEL